MKYKAKPGACVYLLRNESSALPQWKGIGVVKQVSHWSPCGVEAYQRLNMDPTCCRVGSSAAQLTVSSCPLGGQFMILIAAAEVTLLIVTQGITNVGCYLFLASLTFRHLLANTLCSVLCAVVNFLVGAIKKYLTKATSGRKHLFWLRVCRDTSRHGRDGMAAGAGGQLATLHPQVGRREQRCWFSAGFLFMQSRIQSRGIEMSTNGVGLCISIILI